MRYFYLILSVLSTAAFAQDETEQAVQQFIQQLEQRGVAASYSQSILAQAQVKPSILRAINRPSEAKPWHEYRKIFLTDQRIQDGVAFWHNHPTSLAKAEQTYGVPAEIIVAIIGVETAYGKVTGNYRTADALYTLAFFYPKRADFFQQELAEFILLTQEQNLPPLALKGSYAGAMGLGQFMPSSYRQYAVDFDGDGTKRLWQVDDSIGSVAHYLNQYGWQRGQDIVYPIQLNDNEIKLLETLGDKPEKTLAELTAMGIAIPRTWPPHYRASLIGLQQADHNEYYLGFDNFYVITRYNHSHRYAMAVYQLAQAIKAQRPV
jgi:membrane-bound lytic murein transglycosylase B